MDKNGVGGSKEKKHRDRCQQQEGQPDTASNSVIPEDQSAAVAELPEMAGIQGGILGLHSPTSPPSCPIGPESSL